MEQITIRSDGICPGCGRHCNFSELACERGRIFAKTGKLPERENKEKAEREHGEGCGRHGQGHGEGCGRHGEGHGEGCGRHGEGHGEGCGRHGEGHGEGCGQHGRLLQQESYERMSTEEKLLFNILTLTHRGRGCGHAGQRRILAILAERGGTLSQRELLDVVGIKAGSLSEVLSKLETAGYVQRTAAADDRRSVIVTLTEAGSAKTSDAEQGDRSAREALFGKLSEDEKASLLSLLEKAASED